MEDEEGEELHPPTLFVDVPYIQTTKRTCGLRSSSFVRV